MEFMDKVIGRIQLLLGNTYYIRYDYNTFEECFIVRALRNDCNIQINIKFYKPDLEDIEFNILASFTAQKIISEFSEIYDKRENEEE